MPARPSARARLPRREGHYEPWGQTALIDLHGCNHAAVTSEGALRAFLAELVPGIGMVAHGGPIVRRRGGGLRARIRPLALWMLGLRTAVGRFGEGDLEGWTGIQLIETSAVGVHFDEVDDRVYVDVFSCKAFDQDIAVALALAHFGGEARVTGVLR